MNPLRFMTQTCMARSAALSAVLWIAGTSPSWSHPQDNGYDSAPSTKASIASPSDIRTANDSNISQQDSAQNSQIAYEDESKARSASDSKKAEQLKKKVAGAYKDTFYLNDFSYLNDPNYTGYHLGEGLKGMQLGNLGKLDVGGQYRLRYQNEHNMRGFGLTGRDDQFLLDRTRVYADYKITPRARVFVEYLDAGSSFENFAPRQVEVQHFDAQNLFGDLLLIDSDLGKLTMRAGRQELALGAQRLISPLDWANTRRRFDGGRLTWAEENRTTDLLLVRPETVNAYAFDAPNQDQALWGAYHTNKLFENTTADVYYLGYEDTAANLHVHTLGTAFKGELDGFLWDDELGYQFGKNPDGSDISASAITLGIGGKSTATMKPTLWLYYDWASGDGTTNNGWNQLFPLVHRYLGFMDFYGRRNIHDANALFIFNPSDKFSVLTWYHYFFLANGSQGPYNVTNSSFNPGGTVGSRDLGHEIDLLCTYKLNPRSDLVFGYSHFFAGNYYQTSQTSTGAALFNGDADFIYTQWHYNF